MLNFTVKSLIEATRPDAVEKKNPLYLSSRRKIIEQLCEAKDEGFVRIPGLSYHPAVVRKLEDYGISYQDFGVAVNFYW